ncbi:dipicolinate synthase subunit DpsA [Natranaerofaba carboxydovora]|uniref:dipicolinate synthase subunit DpsA n=1 Tax=Natranaerofaba carboxydovora TaxID=2742683 RepID=UPI001F14124C|nr:dipicolinate synthase subunit DpsA [Natranaerofaba carboxydovora]UMZ73423.1 Dipicolinate synthase subunit A [Natranaerofaba carboxydovora]
MELKDYTIAQIGGDEREVFLINDLASRGANILAVGYEKARHNIDAKAIYSLKDLNEKVNAIILPFPGIDTDWNVKAKFTNRKINLKDELNNLEEIPLTIVGHASQELKTYYEEKNALLIEMGENDEIAILNSIPTAEGAISLAIDNTSFTLDDSPMLVLGFGRCGITLVNKLKSLNADVMVVARRPADLARAKEMGTKAMTFDQYRKNELDEYRLIFNTVPELVIDENIVNRLHQDTVIIDIASGKGGVDFEACNRKQINAILAKGIPGKYAPKSAANILAQVYPKILKNYLGR